VKQPVAEDRRLLGRAADLLERFNFEQWSYGDSIGFEGLISASELLGDERWASFATGYFRSWASQSRDFVELDNTAPGHAMCLCYERTHDETVLRAAARLADYLLCRRRIAGVFASFERTPLQVPYGPVELTSGEVALLHDPGAGVFVDCLHFDPPFLVHLGTLLQAGPYRQAGIEQAIAYINLLQDEDTGLFFHFWLERTQRRYIAGWSRGQGWALLGLLDVINRLLPADEATPALRRSVQRLAEGLIKHQRQDGHWWAIADDPDSGDESSTAAFAAAGLTRAITMGVLPEADFGEPAERAWHAALKRTTSEGMLAGVSSAVGACTSPGHYRYVPTGWLVPWGQGPLLLAAHARHRRHDSGRVSGRRGRERT
jgi:unsaturated rhamnogalacturonyl hydrolase